MQISNLINEIEARVKRIASVLLTAASVIALSATVLTAHAANIYGPPGLQPNKIGAGNPNSWAAVSADFNNDGYADLAVINIDTNDLVI